MRRCLCGLCSARGIHSDFDNSLLFRLELCIFERQFKTKFLAEQLYIMIIIMVKFVSGMELHHPFCADTFDRKAADKTCSLQCFVWVRNTEYIVSCGIEYIGMDIN